MAEILSSISLISYILAGISAVIAIFIWFKYNIPLIYGDLSGKNARKSIEKLRESNINSGIKYYRPSTENIKRGKLTATMTSLVKKEETEALPMEEERPETALLKENKAEIVKDDETELLDTDTFILTENDETSLLDEKEITQILSDKPVVSSKRKLVEKMSMIEEVVIVHTDDTID